MKTINCEKAALSQYVVLVVKDDNGDVIAKIAVHKGEFVEEIYNN